ncbi:MAG: SPW repeat protein [Solirubrobacterales bacterium]
MPIGARPTVSYWQDWLNLLIGVWLFISPWALGYSTTGAASWNSWVFGVVVAAIALAALIQFARWEEWLNVAAGLWLVVSPWVMGFADQQVPVWNHVTVGLLVAALALWDALVHRDWHQVLAE